MKEKFIADVLKKKVYYGPDVMKIRDLFSRQQEKGANITKVDDKFFSNVWQVYAWAAILGFLNDKRVEGVDLKHNSFEYFVINNGSEYIANSLILMAVGKMHGKESSEIFDAKKVVTLISEYAEGGARYVLEMRSTPGKESFFDFSGDYYTEVFERGLE